MVLTISFSYVSVLLPLFPLLVYIASFNLRHFGDGVDLAIFILFLSFSLLYYFLLVRHCSWRVITDELRNNTNYGTSNEWTHFRSSKLRRILIFANAKDIDIISDFLIFHGTKDYHDEEKEQRRITQIHLSILETNENNFSRLKNIRDNLKFERISVSRVILCKI